MFIDNFPMIQLMGKFVLKYLIIGLFGLLLLEF